MNHVLFSNPDIAVDEAATKAGLDRAEFSSCTQSDSAAAAVLSDMAEARQNGVEGTPTLFLNGDLLENISAPEVLLRALTMRETGLATKASSAGARGE